LLYCSASLLSFFLLSRNYRILAVKESYYLAQKKKVGTEVAVCV